ncbi:hypothetical protein ACNTMW_23110 [Planosporangium sp. 12N6]|uniref:hypothetical protein n=1 Tax=Planosporangium spinosum TaxID=3402278 RepID=UPI003CF0C044
MFQLFGLVLIVGAGFTMVAFVQHDTAARAAESDKTGPHRIRPLIPAGAFRGQRQTGPHRWRGRRAAAV